MGNQGSTPSLVSTLEKSQDQQVKEIAAEKLMDKVKQYNDHDGYMKAVCSHAGKPLIEMIEKGTAKGQNHAAACLSFIALNAKCKDLLAEYGAIPALIKLLKGGTPELQGAAAAGLANLASRSPKNQAAMEKAGAIPPLVELVKSGIGEARGWAASALGNLALQNAPLGLKVAKAGAIPALVELTKPTSPKPKKPAKDSWFATLWGTVTCKKRAPPSAASKTLEMAARALSSLAFDCEDNQGAIVRAQGIEALLLMAKDGSQKDEVEAVRAISTTWGKDPQSQVKTRLLSGGGERILVDIVSTGTPEGQGTAAVMLARLAHKDPAVRSSLSTIGGLQALVKLALSGTDGNAKLYAIKALRELCEDCPENKQVVQEAGAGPLLAMTSSGMKFREMTEEEAKKFQEDQDKATAAAPADAEAEADKTA